MPGEGKGLVRAWGCRGERGAWCVTVGAYVGKVTGEVC